MSERAIASVLFACSLNAVRSPIAAALARGLRPDLYVASAGVERGDVDGFALAAVEEEGLCLADHRPHSIDELGDMGFDLVVTLSDPAKRAVEEIARTLDIRHEHWDIADPTRESGNREQRLAAYRAVLDDLKARIETTLARAPS